MSFLGRIMDRRPGGRGSFLARGGESGESKEKLGKGRLAFTGRNLEDPRFTNDEQEQVFLETMVAAALEEYGDMTRGGPTEARLLLTAVARVVNKYMPYDLDSLEFVYDADTLSRQPVPEVGYTCSGRASGVAAVAMRAAEKLDWRLYAVPVRHGWTEPNQISEDGHPGRHVVAFVPKLGFFVQPGEGVLTVQEYMQKRGRPCNFYWPVYEEGESNSRWLGFDPKDKSTYLEQARWQGDGVSNEFRFAAD